MSARNTLSATPSSLARIRFRQVPFRSPLLRELFFFLGVLRCFSSPAYLPTSSVGSVRITAQGLPHSEGTGSQPDCGSPVVSLLVYVLHRLIVPRHPPTAHHVLPGHGSLGARGILPHDAFTRYHNTHRTHRRCGVRLKQLTKRFFVANQSQKYVLGKVRLLRKQTLPSDVCIVCSGHPLDDRKSQLVRKTHLILPLSSTRVFVQDDDCAEAISSLERR